MKLCLAFTAALAIGCDMNARVADTTIPAGATASVIPPNADSIRAAAQAESTVVAMLWNTNLDSPRNTLPSSCAAGVTPVDAFIPASGGVAKTVLGNLRPSGGQGTTGEASIWADIVIVADVKSASAKTICETSAVIVSPHLGIRRVHFRLFRRGERWMIEAPNASDSSYADLGGVEMFSFDMRRVGFPDSAMAVTFSPRRITWDTLRVWADSIRKSGSGGG